MKGLWFLLLLCVFAAGVFLGIWIDRSAHKGRNIAYLVTDYQTANLQVRPGDQLSLLDRSGKPKGNLVMDFIGNSACDKNQNGVNSCLLKTPLGTGSYYFACEATPGGPDLCDPGIQQQPTTTTEGKSAEPLPFTGPAIRAIVSCNPQISNTTGLNVLGQNGSNSINAPKGQAIFWTSSDAFSFTQNDFPAKFCGNPDGSGNPVEISDSEYECVVQQNTGTLSYSVQQPTCQSLSAVLNPPVPGPKH
jgi:hypothetical protein